MDYATATSPELADPPPILLVPLGSTEQHGPHLPVDTDTRIAVAWCERTAARRDDVVVAPAIPFGNSGEHAGFPGTLSVGGAALVDYLVELVRSAIPPHRHVVFVNGHGGNHGAVTEVVRRSTDESRSVHAVWPTATGADAHAGHTETSLLLAIAPDTVRSERMEPGNTTPIAELAATLRTEGLAPVTANGVLGDPTGATADHGEALLDNFVARLDQLLGRLAV